MVNIKLFIQINIGVKGMFDSVITKYGHFTQQGMAKKYFLKIWRKWGMWRW